MVSAEVGDSAHTMELDDTRRFEAGEIRKPGDEALGDAATPGGGLVDELLAAAAPEPAAIDPAATPEPAAIDPAAAPEPAVGDPAAAPEPAVVDPAAAAQYGTGDFGAGDFGAGELGTGDFGGEDFRAEDLSEYAEGAEDGRPPVPWRPGWLVSMPYFALSALWHVIVLLILFLLVVTVRDDESEEVPFVARSLSRVEVPNPTGPVEAPKLERVRPNFQARRVEEIVTEIPKGTDLRQRDLTFHDLSLDDALGLSGATSGIYGLRSSKSSLGSEGGGAGTQNAVRAALRWLARHQEPDGSWRAMKHVELGGDAARDYDIGVTGLAVLAFTGDGNTHQFAATEEFRLCVDRALKYLLSVQVRSPGQKDDGRFGKRYHRKLMYDHGIATLAICELLVLSGDVIHLKRPSRAAAEYCLRARNPGRAWRYGYRDGDNDTSVTGWMVLALKTARAARLGIADEEYKTAFRDALGYIRSLTDARGVTGYTDRGRERVAVPCMTSVGVLSRLFAGEKRSSVAIRRGIEQLTLSPPVWKSDSIDMYYWYYATYAQFQYGGLSWQRWNGAMKAALLGSQRQGDPAVDGSWNPVGVSARRAGRVYSTAIGAMTLEVYYRYRRAVDGVEF